MLSHFQSYRQKLFSPEETILLAVSGGIDSVVMCELFHQAGYKFAIAHCNFNLRGNDSDEDEEFVSKLAEKYQVPFFVKSFETTEYAQKGGISIQMAARDLRYDWFKKLIKQEKYAYCATAHHQDDEIESLFINLIRGTGIAGLHGIRAKQGKIIRPLLFATREDIDAFAKANQLPHREDASNADDKYMRNKIRHHLLPLLEEIQPNARQNIRKTMHILDETEVVFQAEISRARAKCVQVEPGQLRIFIEKMKDLENPAIYLFEFLRVYGFSRSQAGEMIDAFDGESGAYWKSKEYEIVKGRMDFVVRKKRQQTPLSFEITPELPFIESPLKMQFEICNFKGLDDVSKKFLTATLDFDKLQFPLVLRRWKEGDRFQPFGMQTFQKLSDFFINQKLSVFEKDNVWILCSGDEIVWVVGMRVDQRFAVTFSTKKIYKIVIK